MASFKTLHSKHKWFLPLVILGIAALIITLLNITKPAPPKKETTEKEWLIQTEALHLGDASPQIHLLGHVESPFNSMLSAAISADVIDVPVRDGQFVHKGDILITLDAREINLSITQKQADVTELEAQVLSENNRYESDIASLHEEQRLLVIAEQGVKRQAKLQASKLVAQERYDSAESQRAQQALSLNARKLNIADHPSRLNQLKARLARAKTALNDALIDRERTLIKAPFDGVITLVSVAPGERVQVGQALVSLYDRANMEVRAQVPDRYVALIRTSLAEGTRIKAFSESYGQISSLELQRLSGQANQKTGGVDAIFTPATPTISNDETSSSHTSALTAPASDLILNSSLQIQVNLPALKNVATLPLSAIYGSNRIYRVEDGRIQSYTVTILGKQFSPETGLDRVIIKSEILDEGDMVTTTQLPNAISGLKVKPRGE